MMNRQAEAPAETLLDLIERSSCPLAELNVYLRNAKPILPFLDKLQELEYLNIHELCFDHSGMRPLKKIEGLDDGEKSGDEVLQCLTVDEGSIALCPRLRHLGLFGIEFNPMLVAPMLDSRCDGVGSLVVPLRSTTITLHDLKRRSEKMAYYRTVLEGCMEECAGTGFQMHLKGNLSDSNWDENASESTLSDEMDGLIPIDYSYSSILLRSP